jgi:hypothetical protein
VKSSATALAGPAFEHDVAPLVAKYCVGCHEGAHPPGAINLSGYHTTAAMLKAKDLWQQVSTNVSDSRMPPAGAPQPTKAERDRIAGYIDVTITNAECQVHDPGRVTLRRLNREEYNDTIRDLFGVDLRPADSFPRDDVGYGFDNIGDVLSMSPLIMEKYLSAAEKIVNAVIVAPEDAERVTHIAAAKMTETIDGGVLPGGARSINTNGDVFIDYSFPHDGDYTLRATACGDQAGPDP